MEGSISNIEEKNGILKFTLSNIDVSIANAIRRTILMDIPLVVFKTLPYEKNKATFIKNTCRLNNEILKQRLGCIPIHINDIDSSYTLISSPEFLEHFKEMIDANPNQTEYVIDYYNLSILLKDFVKNNIPFKSYIQLNSKYYIQNSNEYKYSSNFLLYDTYS